MEYTRMKYGQDQREWVRAADEQLPGLRIEASKAQQHAAECFMALELASPRLHLYFLEMTTQAYKEAHMLLNRVLYYEGMRKANLPKEDES